jgi:hypothetical protein
MSPSRQRSARISASFSLVLAALGFACDHNITHHVYHDDRGMAPAAPERADAGSADGDGPGASTPLAEGLPLLDSNAEELQWDVWGSVAARYWFLISDGELARMNARYGAGDFEGQFDLYSPRGGPGVEGTFADHLVVSTPGSEPRSADFGKVQVRLVGQSTGNAWTDQTLPNIRVDADEFVKGRRVGGAEHLRFNNSVNGGIYREKLTLDLFARLGYPAPRATYVWVSSNVWGPGTTVPYVLVEPYKRQFCKQREDVLGGGCANMWEFVGDLGAAELTLADNCQFSACEPTRALELVQNVLQTTPGAGFAAALDAWVDWDAFHRFQCISWILETGDDSVHGLNNAVLAERADGKFQYFPYSVDVSLGRASYDNVTLPGHSALAIGCQSDPQCWADTVSVCGELIAGFRAADPIGLLDALHATLGARGMLRDGDESRYQSLAAYLETRLAELPAELELNRAAPYYACAEGLVFCDGSCRPPEFCANP